MFDTIGPSSQMAYASMMLILASSSPRRRELLELLGVDYRPVPVELDETILPDEEPDEAVLRLAIAKAEVTTRHHCGSWVIGADTVVAIHGRILGKPADEADAIRMLSDLSGKTHVVYTGIAVRHSDYPGCSAGTTAKVRFRKLSMAEVEAYVATGEPMDKAGAYAVQGIGGTLVDRIEGELSTIVGLTLSATAGLLTRAGISHALS
jgi:septum formation protein